MNDITANCSAILRDPARLQAVRRTALLDTPPEEVFDRLTRLAAKILDAPVALISLLDEDRLFFKSNAGLAPDAVRELPLAQTFCQNNITLEQPLIIEDARTHALVCNHPAVAAFDVVGYLGMPLVDSSGYSLGVLCVIDHRPRAWSTDQISILQDLAAAVITEIELRIAAREAKAARTHADTLLESITDGFVALDSAWRFSYINAEAERLMNLPRAELLGKNHWQQFPATLGTVVETEFRRAVEQQLTVEFENYYAPWRRWFAVKASPSATGGLSIFFREISELKQVEAQAHTAVEQLRLITDSVPALISYIDKNGYYRLNNQAYETWLGHSRAEITGKPIWDVLGEAAWAKVRPHLEAALAGRIVSYESNLPYQNGDMRWISATYTPHIDVRGEVAGIVVLVNDITERHQAEQALRESEERFRTIVNQATTGVVQTDATGWMTLVNRRWCEMIGYSEAELLRMSVVDVTDAISLAPTLEAIGRLAAGGSDFIIEKRYKRKDGKAFWASSSVNALRGSGGEYLGLVAVVLDITERKQAEQLLVEQKNLLELIASGRPLDECLTALTEAVARLQTHTRAAILLADEARKNLTNIVAADVAPSFGLGLRGAPINELAIGTCGTAIYDNEPVTCADIAHDEKWSLPWRELCLSHGIRACHSTPVPGLDGAPLASFMLCFDAAREPSDWERRIAGFGAHIASIAIERGRSIQALRESETRFHALANNMSQFAWMADAKGWIFWYNQRWYDYTGTTLEEMQGRGWQKVHHPDHVQRVVDKISHCFSTGEVWEDTFPLRGKDGKYRWFLSRAIPILDEKGSVGRWFGTNTDITAAKQAESELQALADNLERSNRELRDFASVASHDLQEPLRKILTFGDRLRASSDHTLNEQGQDYLARMQKAARRMRTLITDLLLYSQVTSKPQPFTAVDLYHTAQGVLTDLEILLRETRGTVELGELPVIEADATQIRQLLQNLIGNALKFHRPNETPRVIVRAEVSGQYCLLSVTDNGIGFEPEYAERIFGVFERLHGRHEFPGTGIGLAICRKIVERHGGNIRAESESGLGTTFIITLPVWQSRQTVSEAHGIT